MPERKRESLLTEYEKSCLTAVKFAVCRTFGNQVSDVCGVAAKAAAQGDLQQSGIGSGAVGGSRSDRSADIRWCPAAVAAPDGRNTLGTGRGETGVASRCVAAGTRTRAAMLSFAGSLKVFVAVEACDMRKGSNGFYALVTERLGRIRGSATITFRFSGPLSMLRWPVRANNYSHATG